MAMAMAAGQPGVLAGVPGGMLGSWVEAREEPCRGGRAYRVLVNHRSHQAVELSGTEAAVCGQLAAGVAPGDGAAGAGFVAELRELGFLASDPPAPLPQRRVQASGARLDVRWAGAGQLVRAVHDRGARHLFTPAAVVAQVLLALAGGAAVTAVLISRQQFQLRVHPAQIPVVIGLSVAAVVVHELAHALVVVRHGRTVDAAGVRLHLGTPAFYVESADALLLPRRQRIIQAAAGVWAEWLFTSLIAIWLWLAPVPAAAPLLHRFVLLNAATIATNLLPFTGLDGSWLLADAARVPDLARRSRGALTRVLTALASGQPAAAADAALAGYAAVNGLAAAALLASAGFFWYQLFGDLLTTLCHAGPAGWLTLAAAAVILGRPAATAAAGRLPGAAAAARDLYQAAGFRLQWHWRIPAARHLAEGVPQLGGLSAWQLGVLAGQLRRTRHRRGPLPAALAGTYGTVRAGAITAVSPGTQVTLTPGTTWDPRHRPGHAAPRTILVTIAPAAVTRLLAARPPATPEPGN